MPKSVDSSVNQFGLEYSLSPEGKATVRISDGHGNVESRVSNLHDSLLDLARLALAIQAGDQTTGAVFVVDPGELHFAVEVDSDIANYEVRRFDDWASLQPKTNWQYEVLLAGSTTPEALVRQVRDVLVRMKENPGPDQYKALWQSHDFPVEELEKLEDRINLAKGRRLNFPILLARVFLVVAVAPPVYAIVYWLCTTVFSLYNLIWVPNIISFLVAAEAGWIVWSRSVSLQMLGGRSRAVMLGAIVAGGLGFAGGFYGPLIYLPDSLQAPVVGALAVGSAGLILGGVCGLLCWRIAVRY